MENQDIYYSQYDGKFPLINTVMLNNGVIMFETTVWAGSNPSKNTGSGYGINIPVKIRDQVFNKNWKNIELNLDGESKIIVPISDAFWRKCNEVRSPEIGKWLIKNNAHTWEKGRPTKLKMVHVKGNKFKVSIKK